MTEFLREYDLITKVLQAFDENGSPAELRANTHQLAQIRDSLGVNDPNRAHVSTIFWIVSHQCNAHLARSSGKIVTARRLESECDRLYATLPQNWKW